MFTYSKQILKKISMIFDIQQYECMENYHAQLGRSPYSDSWWVQKSCEAVRERIPPFFCIRVSYVYYPYICLYVDIILLMIYIICFIHTQQIIYMYITGVGEPGFSYTFHPWIFTTFHHQLHGLRSRFPRRHVTALAFRRRGRGLEGGWFMACLPEVSLFAPEKWPKPNRKGGSSSSPTIFQGASC